MERNIIENIIKIKLNFRLFTFLIVILHIFMESNSHSFVKMQNCNY